MSQAELITQSKHWPIEWWSIFALLVLMIGWRHEVGGDWLTYVDYVNIAANDTFGDALGHPDPAYSLLNWLGATMGGGMYLVNLVCAIFFSLGLLKFCLVQPRPWLAVTVAVPYLITVVAMGYTRQGVAIGLAMMAIVALEQKKILQFALWIVLAATFHKSAIILMPLAVLANTKRRIFTLLWVSISGFLLFVLMLQAQLDSLVDNYIQDEMQSSGAAIRVVMNVVPAILFLVFRKRFQMSSEHLSFWTWMSWGALLFVVALNISPSSTAVDRVALYLIPLQLFVLARLPNVLGRRDGKNAVWVYTVVVYSALVLFVWLTYANTAYAWLPYQFYPWVWLWQ